jgi:hypothetical protein
MRSTKLTLLVTILVAALFSYGHQTQLALKEDSVVFAVIGDNGTGARAQYQVADQMAAARVKYPFEFVLMMGDNMYGGEAPKDFVQKFEKPYKALLGLQVKFYAALGNHDNAGRQILYKNFNMGGKHYYSFKPRDGVRFFSLDSNYMDKRQLEWFETELKNSGSEWKIVYFHHPIYSSGEKHGSDIELRTVLEPVMVKYGVDVVLAGHDHFYERIKPQKGIHYFIVGSSGKLRQGNIGRSVLTAKGFDRDNVFLLAQIAGDDMFFEAISRTGATVDLGSIRRAEKAMNASASN